MCMSGCNHITVFKATESLWLLLCIKISVIDRITDPTGDFPQRVGMIG
jgi:hypothetical protein